MTVLIRVNIKAISLRFSRYFKQNLYFAEMRIFLPLFFLGFISASAQTGGKSIYKFLDLPVSAREAAVGGNLISVKDDDINLTFNNPALLSPGTDNSLALSFINYFTDIKYGYAAYAKSFDSIGNFSAGIKFIDYGTFIQADATGLETGTFTASEYLFNLGYSREIDSIFSIGANLKTIYSHLYDYTSIGSAVDLAATYFNSNKRFTATALIKNVGRQWRTYSESTKEPLPFEVQVGISKKPKHVPFRFSIIGQHLQKWDLTYEDPANPSVKTDPITGEEIRRSKSRVFADKLARHLIFGGEFLLTKNFHLRFGYNYLRRKELKFDTKPGLAGFSFGFGFKISKFHLSYGRAVYNVAGTANHFTLGLRLSEFTSRKKS